MNSPAPLNRLRTSAVHLVGPSALALATLAVVPQPPLQAPEVTAVEASVQPDLLRADPRTWLPTDELLRFKVEVTLGPVRGLDVGTVTLACVQTPEDKSATASPAAVAAESSREIASIDGVAQGGYLGRDVHHTLAVRWYSGTQPRIQSFEWLQGSRVSNRESRIGEMDGKWKLEYRRDRHCKGCSDPEHFVDGFLPWSKPSHCKDCQSPAHRVWRPDKYLDVPSDALDIVSALYFARGFLRGQEKSTSLAIVNQDELWMVHLERGEARIIEAPAGKFDCVRVSIGPQLAAGDGPVKKSAERFEALFGLHGNISVWVDRAHGVPVLIEGTAPIGPFDVHVKASLTAHRGG